MKTLYKKDSKDKLRFWSIFRDGADIVQLSGIVGTDSPVEHRKTATPKNVGKANETTPEDQADLEIASAINKKLDKGYFKTKEAADTKKIMPMLANTYEPKNIVWTGEPHIAQPKLDGMRNLAIISAHSDIIMQSRTGKEVTTMGHIAELLSCVKENIILDGELYAHGLSFQENMKLIKKYRKDQSEQVAFHIYDMVSEDDYLTRCKKVKEVVDRIDHPCIKIVESTICSSQKHLENAHQKYLHGGYEGTMVRINSFPYKMGARSAGLLKYKDFIDMTIPIKDIEPAPQMPNWGVPVFEWIGALDDELRAGVKMSHKDREDLLANKEDYIGKTAEVRFFEYSDTGVPRFPVMVGIRLDK